MWCVRRAVVLVVGVLLLGPGCSECDESQCEEDCDDAFPDDDLQRHACYVDCSDRADRCRRNAEPSADADASSGSSP